MRGARQPQPAWSKPSAPILGCANTTIAGAVHLAYQKPLSRAEIAGLAVVVTRLAAAGDLPAARLCQKTAQDLAHWGCMPRGCCSAGMRPLFVTAGGLTAAGDLILGPLRQGVEEEFSRVNLRAGNEPPAAALGRLAIYKPYRPSNPDQ